MNIFRVGSRIISHTSPAAFVATGAALALSIPLVRRGLRSVAVLAVAGVLGITDSLRNPAPAVKSDIKDDDAETQATKCSHRKTTADKINNLHQSTKLHTRQTAGATVSDALAAAVEAENSHGKFHDIMQEAKENQASHTKTNSGKPPDKERPLQPVNLEFITPTPDDTKPVKRSSPRRVRKKELPT